MPLDVEKVAVEEVIHGISRCGEPFAVGNMVFVVFDSLLNTQFAAEGREVSGK